MGMGYGPWGMGMGYGVWVMGYGVWGMGYGVWGMGHGRMSHLNLGQDHASQDLGQEHASGLGTCLHTHTPYVG